MSDLELKTELIHFADHFMIVATEQRDKMPAISYQAFRLSEICRKAAEELKRNIPQKKEMEGGGSTWWYICPECHGAIDRQDHFCRHCGQAVEQMRTHEWIAGRPHQCPVCGKVFWAYADWKYTRKKNRKKTYYCSWPCFRREETTEHI